MNRIELIPSNGDTFIGTSLFFPNFFFSFTHIRPFRVSFISLGVWASLMNSSFFVLWQRNYEMYFCAGCPSPGAHSDQQLYDPVLVCNSYLNISISRAQELMGQHLKKPIATASS